MLTYFYSVSHKYVSFKNKQSINNSSTHTKSSANAEPVKDDIDFMKATQLKALCKQFGLKVSGKKSVLQDRLRGHFLEFGDGGNVEDYTTLSLEDLRDACVVRGLSDEGTRRQLETSLRDDNSYTKELVSKAAPRDEDGYRRISEALAALAEGGNEEVREIMGELREKATAETRHVDVTIRSVGMVPDKFTAGGAPSCTADVLRKLAGDPFEDPPRYGTAYDFFHQGQSGHDACVAL